MHTSLFFLLLGFTISASAQSVDLPAEDPSTASTDNAEIGFDSTADGVEVSDFRNDRPEAPLIMSQKDDNQLCSSNGNNQRPPKRRLRARDWCRKDQYELGPENRPATDIMPPPSSSFQDGEPKEGSAGGGNSGQAGAGQDRRIGKPGTRNPLELPPIPGRTPPFQEEAHDPCSGERTYAVCSPLQPTTYWFPLSLIWATGSLEYCRLCTSFLSFLFSGIFFWEFVCLLVGIEVKPKDFL